MRSHSLIRAAVAAAIVLPAIGCAGGPTPSTAAEQLYHTGQNDAFGAQQDAAVRSAATAPRGAALTAEQQKTLGETFRVGQNNDFGADRTSQPMQALQDYQSRLASTVPMVGGKRDIVGAGGQQDTLARDIYTPGGGESTVPDVYHVRPPNFQFGG